MPKKLFLSLFNSAKFSLRPKNYGGCIKIICGVKYLKEKG